jgi:hypothetical protein
MALLDTTDVRADFGAVYVVFAEEGDLLDLEPDDEEPVVAGEDGLLLNSGRSDHRPRIVISTDPQALAGSPWEGSEAVFEQTMDVPGPVIRVHNSDFSTDQEVDCDALGPVLVKVYRAGSEALENYDETMDVVGAEQWLITLTKG